MENEKKNPNKDTKEKIDKIRLDVLDKDKCKEIAKQLTKYIKNNN